MRSLDLWMELKVELLLLRVARDPSADLEHSGEIISDWGMPWDSLQGTSKEQKADGQS